LASHIKNLGLEKHRPFKKNPAWNRDCLSRSGVNRMKSLLMIVFLSVEFVRKPGFKFIYSDTDLLHGVAFADRDTLVFKRIKIKSDAVGGADFVLAAVAFADRLAIVEFTEPFL